VAIVRNVWSKMSRGDVGMFFDSDVILYPNYMEEILNKYTTNENSSETLDKFLGDLNLRAKMGKACRHYAETVHDFKNVVNMLLSICEILSGCGKRWC